MSRRDRKEGQLFIGRLSKNCRNSDLEDVFEPYGRLLRCEIKYGAEMAYGFVDYEDARDAEDAIKYENGREVAGSAIIVEWAKGTPRRGGGSSRDMRDSRGGRGMDECYRCRRSGHWARDCPDDRHYGYRRPSRRSPRRSSYRSRSRSRDRDRRRSRSRSRDRRRRRSRSRSRSYDRKRSESRSRSKSRSRSRSRDKGQGDNVNGDERSRSRSRSKSGSKSPDRQKSGSPS